MKTQLPDSVRQRIEKEADDGKWLGGSHGRFVRIAEIKGATREAERAIKLVEALSMILKYPDSEGLLDQGHEAISAYMKSEG